MGVIGGAVSRSVSRSPDPLTSELLDFERSRPRGGRSKAREIRERWGLTPTRYHQLLVRAVDSPDALAYDPVLVRRLRRLRDARRRVRLVERLGRSGARG
ncbi:MAG: DUF3263 domain-containing protein [Actinomycetota bacterium]